MTLSPEDMAGLARRIRQRRPLIHHITNLVTVGDVALLTRALGASPVMAHAPQEVAEVARASDGLCLNLGTPTEERLEAMRLALQAAAEAGVPVVMDPVGAGFTAFRTQAARSLLETGRLTVVRGNAAEVAGLAGMAGRGRGVEVGQDGPPPPEAGAELAARSGTCVAVTGEVDHVFFRGREMAVRNGHPLLPQLIGSGCLATAMVAVFLAVEPDPLAAAVAALGYFGAAAELAAEAARGPAGFKVRLLDTLFGARPEEVAARIRLEAVAPVGGPRAPGGRGAPGAPG